MSSHTLAPVPEYVVSAPTKLDLDFANIPVIDFCKNSRSGTVLAQEIRNALSMTGLFYLVNHGYTAEQTKRVFDIADVPFNQVGDNEKAKYVADIRGEGIYRGYKPTQFWHIDGGVRDQIETYDIQKNVQSLSHPNALTPFLSELQAFNDHVHDGILLPILRLLAVALRLPENTFADQHGDDPANETWFRFMKYYPRTTEEEERSNNVWLKGHTDSAAISLLWSQPVSGLQVRTPDGVWKWVKHVENAIIVVPGDTIEILSGGAYKAAIHRVVQPPVDQQGVSRLIVLYFGLADEDTEMVSLIPDDRRKGLYMNGRPLTLRELRTKAVRNYGRSDKGFEMDDEGVEKQVVDGVVLKHYN